MIRKALTSLLILLTGILNMQAIIYRNYFVEDGLSHNSVWAIMQDSNGMMWFGTNEGLDRFDGVSFKVFRYDPSDEGSIGHNFIHCLLESDNGNILVGTKEGLYEFNRVNETFRHIPLGDKNRTSDKTSVHSLVVDKDGYLWVGCYGSGIYKLDKNRKVAAHYGKDKLPSEFINCLCIDLNGDIWAGTVSKGVFCLKPATGKTTASKLSSGNVASIYCDSNNCLWIGTTTDGLYRYNPRGNGDSLKRIESTNPFLYNINNIKSIVPYDAKSIIMSSEGGPIIVDIGTYEISYFNGNESYDNILDNSIFSICQDRDGGMWFGKYFTGVSYCSPLANKFAFYGVGDSQNSIVLALGESLDGNIWLGTRSHGLMRYNAKNHNITRVALPDPERHISSLCPAEDGLWVGLYNQGAILYDPASGQIRKSLTKETGLPSGIVSGICTGSDGAVYFATEDGVAYYADGKTETIKGLEYHPVKDIIEDYGGNLWTASHKYGLQKIEKTSANNFKISSCNLDTQNINTVFQDNDGHIWAGTEANGIYIVDPKSMKVIRHIDQNSSLPSNMIYSFQQDAEGNVWVSTGGGLACLGADGLHVKTFKAVEEQLHFSHSHHSSTKTKDGKLYYGGTNGFLTFDPALVLHFPEPKGVILSGLFIDGVEQKVGAKGSPLTKVIDLMDKIELEAHQNRFSVTLSCPDYHNVSQTEIYYMLEGYDKQWASIPAKQGHVSYTNIPSGKYKLLVKSTNDNGATFSETKSLEINVHRPWLLSIPMIIVYILLGAALVYYIIRTWTRRVKDANTEKMFRFTMDRERELYDQKISFFTNIAHEIRTPLSLISAPLDSIINSGDGTAKTKDNLGTIRKNVNRLLELINQLLDFRKAEVQQMQMHYVEGDIVPVIEDICNRYRDYSRLHDISLTLNMPKESERPVSCDFDPEGMEKIIGNLLSNAIKFSNKSIIVTLTANDDDIKVIVEDDGPGIKGSDLKRIFESFYQVDDTGHHRGTGLGLPLARTLATLHGGSLVAESEYGHGSRFILTIPRKQNVETADTTDTERDTSPVLPTELTSEEENASNGNAMLLLVEDNDELRTFIATELGEFFHIKQARNGIEALHCLETYPVNIIVSDIMMPEMDGMEFCQAVRSRPEHSHLPFILLSAKTDVGTKIEGLNYGADAYVEKPFVMEQLHAQIKTLLDHDQRIRQQISASPLEYLQKVSLKDEHDKETAEFVKSLNDYILENIAESDFSIDGMARHFLMSRSNFHKKIKAITGKTPNDYIRIVRLNRSLELLSSGKYQVVEVCYMVGFNTPWYFSKCFNEHFGKLPNEYLKQLIETD